MEGAPECSLATRAPCQALLSPALAQCAGVLPPASYIAACERELCQGPEDAHEVACEWASQYADQCRVEGLCLAWRRALSCPVPACLDNEHFEECGPGCDTGCDQHTCEDEEEEPACYCDSNMVSLPPSPPLSGAVGWPVPAQGGVWSVPGPTGWSQEGGGHLAPGLLHLLLL